MTYKLWSLIALVISLKSYSQFNPHLLVGKWKLISGKNSDTSITYEPSDQYYTQFFNNGSFKRTHIRNEEWKKGEWIKGTYYTIGKWKLTDSTILMYDRYPVPRLKHVHYSDYTDTLVSLTVSELYIISNCLRTGEGVKGTLFYRRMK